MTLQDAPTAAAEATDATRSRLLSAAGEVFAERGFKSATIREICRRAQANVAAVNYHFGGKQALYNAALNHWVEAAAERFPIESNPHLPPRQRLGSFVQAMLRRIIDDGKPAWHGRLMMREMIEPTSFIDEHMQRFVRPTMAVLEQILRDWPGERVPDDQAIQRELFSVMGQMLFYWHTRQIMPRLLQAEGDCQDGHCAGPGIEELVDHITAFTAAALDERRRSTGA